MFQVFKSTCRRLLCLIKVGMSERKMWRVMAERKQFLNQTLKSPFKIWWYVLELEVACQLTSDMKLWRYQYFKSFIKTCFLLYKASSFSVSLHLVRDPLSFVNFQPNPYTCVCLWEWMSVFVTRLRAIMFVSFKNNWYGLRSVSPRPHARRKAKVLQGLKVQRKEKVMRDFSFDGGASNNNVWEICELQGPVGIPSRV